MTEQELIVILKRQRYLQGLFGYGFITLCYLIEKYEAEGNYEECQIILDAIQEVNSIRKLDLPTKYDDKAWQYFLDAMGEFGLSGKITASNIPYYAELIERDIASI